MIKSRGFATVDKDKIAEILVREHFKAARSIKEIYRILSDKEEDPNEPIKLIEINDLTPEVGTYDLEFSPADEILFPSNIVELSSKELEKVKKRQLHLPKGWDLNKSIHYLRPPDLQNIE